MCSSKFFLTLSECVGVLVYNKLYCLENEHQTEYIVENYESLLWWIDGTKAINNL